MTNIDLAKKILIITGMHRSGTSLTASLLQSAGVDIGDNLMQAGFANVKGHFEDLEFVHFHEDILRSQGFSTEGWTLEKDIEVQEQYLKEAKSLINKNIDKTCWGWKDPRTTLFLNFWSNLIPEAKFLFVYRSPWEVIDSLYCRGDKAFLKNPNFALAIWTSYNRKILDFCGKFPESCLIFEIDNICNNPSLLVETINSKFGFSLNSIDTSIYSPSLLHHEVSNSHRPTLIHKYFPDVINLYRELSNKSDLVNGFSTPLPDTNKVNLVDYKAWILQDWLDIRQAEREIKQSEFQLDETRSQLEQSQSELQLMRSQLEQSQSELHSTRSQLEQSQSELHSTRSQLEQSQSELHSTRSQLEQSKSELHSTRSQLEQSQSELEQSQVSLYQTQVGLSQSQYQLEQTRSQISWLKSSKYWKIRQKLSRLKSSPSQFIGSIDSPQPKESVPSNFQVLGWCISTKSSSIIGVRAKVQGKTFEGKYGLYRPDVDLIYPLITQAELSGFEISVSLSPEEEILLEVEILDNLGNWHLIGKHSIKLDLPPEPVVEEPLNWQPEPITPYQAWLRVNEWNQRSQADLISRLSAWQGDLPKISVVMPVYNPQVRFLEEAIASVVDQVYPNWELCIADDCSTNPQVHRILKQWEEKDERIHVIFRETNGNISAATNTAASLASGEFIAFLDHDDKLTPDAFGEVALYLAEHPETDFLYSDDDKIDIHGNRFDPQFKPDWSPELLLSYAYFSHLSVVRRSIFEKVGGIRVGFEGSQDYDFALRATEISRQVGHIPLVLYHWRAVTGSTATSGEAKPDSFMAGQKAVQEALERRAVSGIIHQPEWALKGGLGIFEPQFPDEGPSVSIIIPTKNRYKLLKACLDSLNKTTYKDYEVIIIDNESDDPQTLAYFKRIPHQVIRIENPNNTFNFAAINNRAVEKVNSDYVLFLNNDTEVISPRWLSQMIGYAQFSGVGSVGAKLLYPDQRIQHAGIIHGLYHGLAGPAFKLMPSNEYGYLCYTKVARNYSAVTAACLLTPRQLFLEMGGFDEDHFAVAYNDVDYCYRLVEKGYRCVYCPTAELIHKEGTSRGFSDNPQEPATLKRKYSDKRDPYYNPHLSFADEQFRIQPRHLVLSEVKPIKTLVCTHNLNLEGAPNSQFELTRGLKERGIINPIVYSPEDGVLRQDYEKAGIEVYVKQHPLAGVTTPIEYDKAIFQFSQFLKEHEIELVYANTLQTFYAIASANVVGIPSIWNPRESEPWQTYFNHFGSDIALEALKCFALPYKTIFVADATRDRYLALNSHSNFTVIHNALNLERLEEKRSLWTKGSAREFLDIPESEVVLLLLGTICERKGQQDIVKALAKLPQRWHYTLKVFIVGDRPNTYSDELKSLVSELPQDLNQRIEIVPETDDTALYYQAADIFVFTSRIESFPRVILEAMVYNLPIITTPVFGVQEQVQNGVNALFYQPGDSQELASAIELLLEDEKLRSRFATNASHVLNCLNSFDEMVESYGEIFQEAYFSRAR